MVPYDSGEKSNVFVRQRNKGKACRTEATLYTYLIKREVYHLFLIFIFTKTVLIISVYASIQNVFLFFAKNIRSNSYIQR